MKKDADLLSAKIWILQLDTKDSVSNFSHKSEENNEISVLSANSIDSNYVKLVTCFVCEADFRNCIFGSSVKALVALCHTRPPHSSVNAFRICPAPARRLKLPIFFFPLFPDFENVFVMCGKFRSVFRLTWGFSHCVLFWVSL